MNNEFKYIKEGLTADLLEYLIVDYNMNIQEALRFIYESDTFSKLCNPATGLYIQSSKYIYSYLKEEIENGQFY